MLVSGWDREKRIEGSGTHPDVLNERCKFIQVGGQLRAELLPGVEEIAFRNKRKN